MRPLRRPIALASAAILAGTLAGCSSPSTEAEPECLPPQCVVIDPAEPILIGSLLNIDDPISRDTAAIVAMSIDYLDGEFDGLNGQLLNRPVELISELEACSAST